MKNKKLLFFWVNTSIFLIIVIFSLKVGISEAVTGINLIQNPSLEIAGGGDPNFWFQAGFGDNDRVFIYGATDGVEDSKAVSVSISTYTAGDAKWYFAPVPITPGHSYAYSDNYVSAIDTQLVAEYFDTEHNHLGYDGFISIERSPATAGSWGVSSATFLPPEGAAYMTVFHLINKVGFLRIDNANLSEVPPVQAFNQGFVTLSFDDGFLSQYQNAAPELTTADMKGTFYIVSHAISGISINNPSFENGITGWENKSEPNATYTYPSEGHSGLGAKVSSAVENSDAGWYFTPITALNDSVYSFSEWYNSNTNGELVALITKADNSVIPADVTDAAGVTLGTAVTLPATESWVEVNTNFYIPADAKNVTIVNRLKGIGDFSIDDVNFGVINHMNSNQVLSLSAQGNEIGGHSQSHRDLSILSEADRETEVNGSLEDLLATGLSNVRAFSYPYGIYNTSIQGTLEKFNFTSGRAITEGYNGIDTNKYSLLTQPVTRATTLAMIQSWVTKAITDKTWLILVFHDVKDSLVDDDPYGISIENFKAIVNYLKTNNVPVKTVSEGVALMGEVVPPGEATLSSIAITTPATKLSYIVGEALDISGLVVTGTYSDDTTRIETIASSNIIGFNSSVPATNQILTITVGDKSATYPINILADDPTNPEDPEDPDNPEAKEPSTRVHGYMFGNYWRYMNNITPLGNGNNSEKKIEKAKYKFIKNLRKGLTMEDIKELQSRLSIEGDYDGPVTGFFGVMTYDAVVKYQSRNGLPRTGYVGPLTRGILNS